MDTLPRRLRLYLRDDAPTVESACVRRRCCLQSSVAHDNGPPPRTKSKTGGPLGASNSSRGRLLALRCTRVSEQPVRVRSSEQPVTDSAATPLAVQSRVCPGHRRFVDTVGVALSHGVLRFVGSAPAHAPALCIFELLFVELLLPVRRPTSTAHSRARRVTHGHDRSTRSSRDPAPCLERQPDREAAGRHVGCFKGRCARCRSSGWTRGLAIRADNAPNRSPSVCRDERQW